MTKKPTTSKTAKRPTKPRAPKPKAQIGEAQVMYDGMVLPGAVAALREWLDSFLMSRADALTHPAVSADPLKMQWYQGSTSTIREILEQMKRFGL
jgi:hypothetical protein